MARKRQHSRITTILLDIEGVLTIEKRAIPGAVRTLETLHGLGYHIACVTNATTRSQEELFCHLQNLGFDLKCDQIFTPISIVKKMISHRTVALYTHPHIKAEFSEFEQEYHHPEVVLLGDGVLGGYTPELLQSIFQQIMRGATLIALHKNRYWQKSTGLHIDLGAYVAALEYATGSKAYIAGKPSPEAFLTAIAREPKQSITSTLFVGDDIEIDIGGAQALGMRTILVQTGKFRKKLIKASSVQPDLIIPSITDLIPALLLL
ncbi:MAG: HAD-IIA family hydrolase [Zetaproteobacteria bacterium]|nr:HAD-IIA family hydrolase [Zetaproteobacteria bacterium]